MESVFISRFWQHISVRSVFLQRYCKPRPRYFHGKRTAARAAMEDDPVASSCKVVTISYEKLLDRDANLFEEIEAGFGQNGLGIIAISKVPNFPTLRKNLLHLSHRLAALPEEAKKQLEDPDSRYSFGWSHGKEKLESGQPDKWKGSFYANPVVDIPTTDEILLQSTHVDIDDEISSWCGWHTDHSALTGCL